MVIKIVDWSTASAGEKESFLQRPALSSGQDIAKQVRGIIADVRSGGDKSLCALTKKFDSADLEDFRVSASEISRAEGDLSSAQIRAIELAINNVRRFHEAQIPHPVSIETMPGVHCERISQAIEAVGLYVPAGSAPLPSAAIMLAVPAAIAGCPTKYICTPPRADGCADSAVLVAAKLAGVDTIFKLGGAQAIAAMAYGTETVPRVAKIFGPGNAWVTEAKSQVASDPLGAAIDMPAGPSEVLVIADNSANAAFVAADMLSQAEHGVDSQALLLTTSDEIAQRVAQEIDAQIETLTRQKIARQSIRNSHIIVLASVDMAIETSNRYAPEHLILHLENGRGLLPKIRNAGSVFVGPWSPESVGDYCSGTNHVLPTYGHARSFSGLGTDQFMRNMTIQELSPDGLRAIGDAVMELASLEGLDAHASAVQRRLTFLGQSS